MIFTHNASHISNFKFYQIENRVQKCTHFTKNRVLTYNTSTFFQNTMISIFTWLVPLTRKLISLLCIFRTEGSTTEDEEGKCLERNFLSRPSETFSISWHEWSKRHVLTSSWKDLRFEKNFDVVVSRMTANSTKWKDTFNACGARRSCSNFCLTYWKLHKDLTAASTFSLFGLASFFPRRKFVFAPIHITNAWETCYLFGSLCEYVMNFKLNGKRRRVKQV